MASRRSDVIVLSLSLTLSSSSGTSCSENLKVSGEIGDTTKARRTRRRIKMRENQNTRAKERQRNHSTSPSASSSISANNVKISLHDAHSNRSISRLQQPITPADTYNQGLKATVEDCRSISRSQKTRGLIEQETRGMRGNQYPARSFTLENMRALFQARTRT